MLKTYLETFKKYKYLLQNLISRDFKVKYRRSVLGIAWSLLNPIFMMLIISTVFSAMMGRGVEHYPIFIMTGQIVFIFFNEATTSANFSVVEASQLIKKVYVPKYIFPVERVLFSFVNLMFSLVAVFIMMLLYRVPLGWSMLLFFVPLSALLLFTMGFGLMLSALCVFFRDLKHLYSIVITAWMYVSPIIYPLETMQGSWLIYVLYANPLTWYVEYFRSVMFYIPTGQAIPFPLWLMAVVCFGVGIVFLALGLLIFHKLQDKFILYV